jgi:hypothetical protein
MQRALSLPPMSSRTRQIPGEWIVFFKKSAGRSYFLVDDNDEVESFSRLDDLIEVVRGLGIKFAEIHM